MFLNCGGVGQLHIVVFLIGQQVRDQFHVFLGDTARDQLVQQQGHLRLGKGPALQQDLTDGQNFTVGHERGLNPVQNKPLPPAVVDDVILPALPGGPLSQIGPQFVNIPLYRAGVDAEPLGYFLFIDHMTRTQAVIKEEEPEGF